MTTTTLGPDLPHLQTTKLAVVSTPNVTKKNIAERMDIVTKIKPAIIHMNASPMKFAPINDVWSSMAVNSTQIAEMDGTAMPVIVLSSALVKLT